MNLLLFAKLILWPVMGFFGLMAAIGWFSLLKHQHTMAEGQFRVIARLMVRNAVKALLTAVALYCLN